MANSRKFHGIAFYGTVLLFAIFISFFSLAIKMKGNYRYFLSDSFEWCVGNENETIEQAENFSYRPIPKDKRRNICSLVGTKGQYVWIKIDFELPDELKNQNVSLVIPYLHFADETWINGNFIGSGGNFPPKERSALFEVRNYVIPETILNQTGKNRILIKLWAHGGSEISNDTYIASYATAKQETIFLNFSHCFIYVFFEGGMFTAFLLFTLSYFGRKKEKRKKDYIVFALLNLFVLDFAAIFFARYIPVYEMNVLPFLWFYKIVMCMNFVSIIYFVNSFVINRLYSDPPPSFIYIRLILFIIPYMLIILAKDYDALIKIMPYCLLCLCSSVAFCFIIIIKCLCVSTYRKNALDLIKNTLPVTIGIILDFVMRNKGLDSYLPYFTYFGFQIEIIVYLINFTTEFNKSAKQNEYLNENLKLEVDKKTEELSISNSLLEEQLRKSNVDLQMAAIVQKKFFPYPRRSFLGWDISVLYKPLASVSGDLYDYYSIGNMLDGIALFDVSGHGVSASLITVLAKSLIMDIFKKARFSKQSASEILNEINEKITEAKGSVDNYLTGLIFKFGIIDSNGNCEVNFSNAGHPYPIFYSVKNDECTLLGKDNASVKQYGAIGLSGVDVSYVNHNFTMAENDILVCYTDGITEAMNDAHEQFSRERLINVINIHKNETAKVIQDYVMRALFDFIGDVPLEDDITLMILKRDNPKDYLEEISAD